MHVIIQNIVNKLTKPSRIAYRNVFYTSDEHYFHRRILLPEYSNRPFTSVEHMTEVLVANHNSVVGHFDLVIHVGDFTLSKNIQKISDLIVLLNGEHIFLKGSHDYWLDILSKREGLHFDQIHERNFGKDHLTACHYAMRTWPRSHYNSWHVYGHSHGRFQNDGKSWDVGVDNNNYTPVSFQQIQKIMSSRPDNQNYSKHNLRKRLTLAPPGREVSETRE